MEENCEKFWGQDYFFRGGFFGFRKTGVLGLG